MLSHYTNKTVFQRFIAECPDDASSSIYLSDAEEDEIGSMFTKCYQRIGVMFRGRRGSDAYQRID